MEGPIFIRIKSSSKWVFHVKSVVKGSEMTSYAPAMKRTLPGAFYRETCLPHILDLINGEVNCIPQTFGIFLLARNLTDNYRIVRHKVTA